jgi:MFS family permease
LVQIAPTLGLVLSIAAIVVVQYTISFKRFVMFGWRIPFLLSILLIGLSFYIRSRVPESQVFQRLKEKGTPAGWLAAGSGGGNNLRLILEILGGALAGQGLLWYMAQLYVLFYLQNILKVDPFTATCTVAVAHLLGMPCFIFFGALSDKVGRRKIILSGCLLAAFLYVPVYAGMERATGTHVTRVVTAKNPVTGTRGPIPLTVIDGTLEPAPEATNPNLVALVLLVFVQVVVLAAVSGPLGAYCAETFRSETRYTSVGLTYHLGNGLLTGLLPLITLPLIATTGDVRAILYCVVALTLCIFMVGVFFLKESAMRGRQNQAAE